MRAPWRNRFDPSREFVARRTLSVGGESFAPGQAFRKELVNTRRLRQLFDHRTLIYAGEPMPGSILPVEADPAEIADPEPALETAVQDEKATAKAEDLLPERTAIEIPTNWAELPWPQRLSLAASLTDEGVKVHNSAEAAEAIEAELARRAIAS